MLIHENLRIYRDQSHHFPLAIVNFVELSVRLWTETDFGCIDPYILVRFMDVWSSNFLHKDLHKATKRKKK